PAVLRARRDASLPSRCLRRRPRERTPRAPPRRSLSSRSLVPRRGSASLRHWRTRVTPGPTSAWPFRRHGGAPRTGAVRRRRAATGERSLQPPEIAANPGFVSVHAPVARGLLLCTTQHNLEMGAPALMSTIMVRMKKRLWLAPLAAAVGAPLA